MSPTCAFAGPAPGRRAAPPSATVTRRELRARPGHRPTGLPAPQLPRLRSHQTCRRARRAGKRGHHRTATNHGARKGRRTPNAGSKRPGGRRSRRGEDGRPRLAPAARGVEAPATWGATVPAAGPHLAGTSPDAAPTHEVRSHHVCPHRGDSAVTPSRPRPQDLLLSRSVPGN